MATIDGRYVFVEQEDPSYEVDVTEQPVEDNVSLTDHVQRKARTMNISGMIVGDDAAEIKEYLIRVQDSGSIVEYDGRNYFVGLLTGFTTSHNYKVGNGFTFSASLKEVVIAESSYIEKLPTPIRASAAPVISSGRKQTKTKKGKKDEPVEKVKFKAGSPWAEE
ncbi:phage baseplate protein [Paenibacillus sp. 32352]|uniref:phage baseplate protein n=1 Tax=Paenibacillus sp. 32352 TaxID=1969111 RepID=UPI0009AD785A|nr:hypothetical protein [Paenibacillus sp. 32352]